MPHATLLPELPWHTGERLLQERAGVHARMEEIGKRVVRDHMPDQHRDFFAQLPVVVLGAVAPDGRVWATLRAGHPGFLHSPDPRLLEVSIGRDPADPADPGMDDGNAIGLLGIDPMTRRRNRMNGRIDRIGTQRFRIAVGQSFGNCPQYIQQRAFDFTRDPGVLAAQAPRVLPALDDRARALIADADTFFVASYVDLPGGQRQVDVSHRGGPRGFVRRDADGGLTIPDYSGNRFFNTLGNLAANPIAGLVFVDYATGDLLQLSGRAEVLTDSPEIAAFEGAERLWRVIPDRVVWREAALPLRWHPEAPQDVNPPRPAWPSGQAAAAR